MPKKEPQCSAQVAVSRKRVAVYVNNPCGWSMGTFYYTTGILVIASYYILFWRSVRDKEIAHNLYSSAYKTGFTNSGRLDITKCQNLGLRR